MTRTERQFAILSVLWVRKKDTIANLAVEFGVSIRTIKDDVQIIMLYHPIETKRGRDGGVSYMKDYNPPKKIQELEEIELLVRVRSSLSAEDMALMDRVISRYNTPW